MDERAAQLSKRLAQLQAERSRHESMWSDCYRYGAPERQQSFQQDDIVDQRKKERADLLDSTAAEGLQTLVASMISGTVPANSIWFRAVPDGMDDPAELTEGEHWLDAVCQFIWRNIHGANFDSEILDHFIDYACAGWAVLYADIDRKKGAGYVFEAWAIGECFIASSRQDLRIDTIYRVYRMSAAAMVNEYGEKNVSDEVLKAYRSTPDKQYRVLWAIQPRAGFKQPIDDRPILPKEKAFETLHFDLENKQIMRESGYDEFPCMVPRYRRIPGSVYGIGAMATVLPEAKQLNAMTRDYLRAIEMAAIGMYTAVDDGGMNPRTVRLGPGKIIIVDKPDSLQRIDDARGAQVSIESIKLAQANIRRKLQADALTPPYNTPMTAAETYQRIDMIRQQLGPLYGRIQSELLVPMLERCFGLAYRAGVLNEAPEDLQGRGLSFKFISPLARAQKMEDVAAIERLIGSMGALLEINPDALDNIDTDAVPQVMAQGLGAPTSIMRTADGLKAYREQKAQAQAQAQAQQQEAVATQQLGNAVSKGLEAQLTSEAIQ
ncbi:head-tail connector protein [Acinetobacter sp. FL51]|uniref:portal protein n=1 Tax=Acinetobacter sp. FL51 TaxID=2777978 RepID=UPI0018E1A4DA|nr:portal protein [Acinetobacter sp. FL51]MBI1450394.1 head-tail connector protein [Acinetobacter sp. FL51]